MHLACLGSFVASSWALKDKTSLLLIRYVIMETMIHTSTSVVLSYFFSLSSSCVLALSKKAFVAKVASSSKQVQLGLFGGDLSNATGRARIQRERSKGVFVQAFPTNTVPQYADK